MGNPFTRTATIVFCGLALIAGTAAAEEPSQEEMMAKWMELAQPAEHHSHFNNSAGNWDVTGKMWMEPGQPPVETTGTATFEVLLGGRYLKHDYSSSFMSMPFNGIGIAGSDNLKQEHFSIWIDDFSTGTLVSTGSCTDNCSVITEYGEYPELDGSVKKYKSVVSKIDEDHFTLEMYEVGEKEIMTMQLTYTRAESK